MEKVFEQTDDFEAMRAAKKWCAENNISCGRLQGDDPIGLKRGDWTIEKWRNLSDADKDFLDGTMQGDMRYGPVTVELKMILLKEIYRENFGNDQRAINRHSVRRYEAEDGTLYQLDRTLGVGTPFFALCGPFTSDFQGVLPTIKVDGKDYWGDGYSWKQAEAVMCDVLNAILERKQKV